MHSAISSATLESPLHYHPWVLRTHLRTVFRISDWGFLSRSIHLVMTCPNCWQYFPQHYLTSYHQLLTELWPTFQVITIWVYQSLISRSLVVIKFGWIFLSLLLLLCLYLTACLIHRARYQTRRQCHFNSFLAKLMFVSCLVTIMS